MLRLAKRHLLWKKLTHNKIKSQLRIDYQQMTQNGLKLKIKLNQALNSVEQREKT